MTIKRMVEDIQQIFPQYGRTQVLFEINKAMREFCGRTGIYNGVAVRNRLTHLVSEDATTPLTIYSLPANVYEVWGVDELIRDIYQLRDDELWIALTDPDMDELTIRYTALPAPLIEDNEFPLFEERFHDAIVCMVKQRLYSRAGNGGAARIEYGYVKEAEVEARKYINSSPYRNTGAFTGDDMGLIIAYGAQDLISGLNTISFAPKVYASVNSFRVMLNGNGITVEEYDPNNNHDQRTVSSIKVVSADTNTNFEYFVVGT